ncbi:MAG TPA: response regulator [Tepidisphaeraceae bacterium]
MSATTSAVCLSSHRTDPKTSTHPAKGHGRILVATYSSEGRRMISGMLRCIGLEISVAGNGREVCDLALSAWKAGEGFDLILMDMNLQQIDGYEGTALLRSMGYDGRIVALMPEFTFPSTHQKCLAAGCDGYASKPINFGMLRDVVERFVPSALTDSRDAVGY